MHRGGLFHEADRFAHERHLGQTRKDARGTAYIEHPRAVVRVLRDIGCIHDENVLIAGLLHDVIEDTATTPKELRARFGVKISQIVLEVSDDKRLPKVARKYLQVRGHPSSLLRQNWSNWPTKFAISWTFLMRLPKDGAQSVSGNIFAGQRQWSMDYVASMSHLSRSSTGSTNE